MQYRIVAITPLGRFTSVLLTPDEALAMEELLRNDLSYLMFKTAETMQVRLMRDVVAQSVFQLEELPDPTTNKLV